MRSRPFRAALPFALALGCWANLGGRARADEGMWLPNQFPAAQVKQAYGFAPDDNWLKKVRLGSVRLAGGCSGSLVSQDGLVLTNHHCSNSCIQQLSTPTDDKIKSGFLAKTRADEVRCPEIEINQLTDITEVTAQVQKAIAGLEGQAYSDARKAVIADIEKACASSDQVRCDVVTLFHGARYDLYKYRRYQDVRLVFAPELAIGFFGGDPDNFNFPRYDLDLSILRVYDNGKPLQPSEHFRLSSAGTKEGDLTFVSGHPGGTNRQLTVAELLYQRDVGLPDALLRLAELRGTLTEYQRRGAEEMRHSESLLFGLENSYKALRGREEALTGSSLLDTRRAEEADFRQKLQGRADLVAQAGGSFDAIAQALAHQKEIRKVLAFEEQGRAFQSSLFTIARTLVRGATERPKPNPTRYPEFNDSALPQLTQRLFSKAPIYPELEIATLTFSLTKLREELGADHPFVRKVLGKKSPATLARELVNGTQLAEVSLRQQLWDGGANAVGQSHDPMIVLAQAIDADGRAVRKLYEDTIESTLRKNEEAIATARTALNGTHGYPDATFTLRLSYGQVKGWQENGSPVAPYTTFGGAFDRATGEAPFDLPPSWLAAQSKLDRSTPFDFVTTNDIIGGNSGSPVLDRKPEVVGLIFDGNIHSLGGDFGYDGSLNRAVAVDSRAILAALRQVYGADRLASELAQ